ncbi:hypothetical protein Mapa_008285 [Marchantia paleacea]|nr:hypothetical protein Mapa_008285 [Marchantia paleacea]
MYTPNRVPMENEKVLRISPMFPTLLSPESLPPQTQLEERMIACLRAFVRTALSETEFTLQQRGGASRLKSTVHSNPVFEPSVAPPPHPSSAAHHSRFGELGPSYSLQISVPDSLSGCPSASPSGASLLRPVSAKTGRGSDRSFLRLHATTASPVMHPPRPSPPLLLLLLLCSARPSYSILSFTLPPFVLPSFARFRSFRLTGIDVSGNDPKRHAVCTNLVVTGCCLFPAGSRCNCAPPAFACSGTISVTSHSRGVVLPSSPAVACFPFGRASVWSALQTVRCCAIFCTVVLDGRHTVGWMYSSGE